MKKVLLIVSMVFLGAVTTNVFSQIVRNNATTDQKLVLRLNDSMMRILPNAILPAGHTFYVYENDKAAPLVFKGGQKFTMLKGYDCVEYKCPPALAGNRCWRCKKGKGK